MAISQHAPDAQYTLEFLNAKRLGPLAKGMGVVITECTPERIVATTPVEGNTQPFGLMHGGAYMVIGETLGSIHANYLAPEGMIGVGIDINATHTGSAVEGIVTAVCQPIHVGRSLAVHEIVIENEQGRRCSTVRITNFYKEMPK